MGLLRLIGRVLRASGFSANALAFTSCHCNRSCLLNVEDNRGVVGNNGDKVLMERCKNQRVGMLMWVVRRSDEVGGKEA